MEHRTTCGLAIGLVMITSLANVACSSADPAPEPIDDDVVATIDLAPTTVAPSSSVDDSDHDENEPDENEPDEDGPDEA